MKYIVIILVVLGLVAGLSLYQPSNSDSNPETSDMILFWGDGCPHCVTVKNYIKDNNLNTLLKITDLEVYYNRTNQKLLQQKANLCPEIVDKTQVGVPFAFIPQEKRCLIGDQPIINWLEPKLNSKQ